jgi:hypothetical protein
MMLAMLIDTKALGEVILYSLVASVGGTMVFSFAIVGLARFDEARQGDRKGSGAIYAVLVTVCALIITGMVVEAIILMTQK